MIEARRMLLVDKEDVLEAIRKTQELQSSGDVLEMAIATGRRLVLQELELWTEKCPDRRQA